MNPSGDPYNQNDDVARGVSAAQRYHPSRPETDVDWSSRKAAIGNDGAGNDGAVTNLIGSPVQDVWKAREKPSHEQFYYRPTALSFSTENVTVQRVAENIYEFCETQFTVEMQKLRPEKGTLNLAVFSDMMMVVIKLRIWKETQAKKIVVECELRDGCSLAFGKIFRQLKNMCLPDMQMVDATPEVVDDHLHDLDLSLDALGGVEPCAPTIEEWRNCLENGQESELSCIEGFCTIAASYDPSLLSSLAQLMKEEKIGFEAAGKKTNESYASLWSISRLIVHMSEDPDCLKHLVGLCDSILNAIFKQLDKPYFSVLASLANAYYSIVKNCGRYQMRMPNAPSSWPRIPGDAESMASKAAMAQSRLDAARAQLE